MAQQNNQNTKIFDQDQPDVITNSMPQTADTLANSQLETPTAQATSLPVETLVNQTAVLDTPSSHLLAEHASEPRPANYNKESRLKKATAVVAGLAALTGVALGIAKIADHGDESTQLRTTNEPTTTAAPASTYEQPTLPPTSIAEPERKSSPTSTESVSEKPTITATPSPAEAENSNILSESELKDIINATGFKGLEGHNLEVVDRFNDIVIVSVDGSKLPVPLSEIKNDLAIAKRIAAQHPSFTVGNPGEETEYQAAPSSAAKRYILVTDKDPRLLSDPVPSFADSYTTSNPAGINVTVIKNQPSETRDGVDANSFYTAVEAFQTETFFTPYAQENRARERFTNSWGYAVASARAGIPYGDYAAQAATIPLRAYTDGDHYFIVSQESYNSLI